MSNNVPRTLSNIILISMRCIVSADSLSLCHSDVLMRCRVTRSGKERLSSLQLETVCRSHSSIEPASKVDLKAYSRTSIFMQAPSQLANFVIDAMCSVRRSHLFTFCSLSVHFLFTFCSHYSNSSTITRSWCFRSKLPRLCCSTLPQQTARWSNGWLCALAVVSSSH